MNRFLVASALVGSTLGLFHGRAIRQPSNSISDEIIYSVRDATTGAVVYPFIIPISVYQLATKTRAENSCIFKTIFSPPLSERRLQ